MPNLDFHLPALRARTLTAATVQSDGALDEAEKRALLTLIGMRENSPKPECSPQFRVIKAIDTINPTSWVGNIDIPLGELQSISFEVIANPTSSPILFTMTNSPPQNIPYVGRKFEYACREGETLSKSITVSLPVYADVDDSAIILVTYTLL